MTMMATLRDLPNDLVEEEILCCVSGTCLKRLKSTCKQWNRLFNGDSRFARKHTDRAPKQLLLLTAKAFRICPTIVNLHGSVEFKSELTLVDSQSIDSAQFDLARVFHCDGLLLCTSKDATRFVVWNPFTGETRWFQPRNFGWRYPDFVLGYSYQEGSNKKSYKILSFSCDRTDAEIYEFSSDSWRTVDAIMPPGWTIEIAYLNLSLKGNTYWFAEDPQGNMSLLKFDFRTEKSIHVPLPHQSPSFVSRGVLVVGGEKLSVLLQREYTSKTEIWVTNKIDETKTTQVVSWSKVLALDLCSDLQIWNDVNFVFDEKKKVVMMCMPWFEDEYVQVKGKHMIYSVGEDAEVVELELGPIEIEGVEWVPEFLNYVPTSLVQIEQATRGKRKRADPSNM